MERLLWAAQQLSGLSPRKLGGSLGKVCSLKVEDKPFALRRRLLPQVESAGTPPVAACWQGTPWDGGKIGIFAGE